MRPFNPVVGVVAKPAYPLAVPDSVLRVFIDTDGGSLAALDSRPVGSAQGTAVFVPGFSGSKEDFIPMLAVLVPRQTWFARSRAARGLLPAQHGSCCSARCRLHLTRGAGNVHG